MYFLLHSSFNSFLQWIKIPFSYRVGSAPNIQCKICVLKQNKSNTRMWLKRVQLLCFLIKSPIHAIPCMSNVRNCATLVNYSWTCNTPTSGTVTLEWVLQVNSSSELFKTCSESLWLFERDLNDKGALHCSERNSGQTRAADGPRDSVGTVGDYRWPFKLNQIVQLRIGLTAAYGIAVYD